MSGSPETLTKTVGLSTDLSVLWRVALHWMRTFSGASPRPDAPVADQDPRDIRRPRGGRHESTSWPLATVSLEVLIWRQLKSQRLTHRRPDQNGVRLGAGVHRAWSVIPWFVWTRLVAHKGFALQQLRMGTSRLGCRDGVLCPAAPSRRS